MRVLKNIFSQLHTFILIALLSTVFWLWIFTIVTDTAAENKIVVFFDVPSVNEKALDLGLEKNMPDGIKMIRVHTFDYAMFDDGSLQQGDIFVIRRSNMEKYAQDLADMHNLTNLLRGVDLLKDVKYNSLSDADSAVVPNSEYFLDDEGRAVGIKVYSAEDDCGLARKYVNYIFPDGKTEDCFLCYGAKSLHTFYNENAVDNAAGSVVYYLLKLPLTLAD